MPFLFSLTFCSFHFCFSFSFLFFALLFSFWLHKMLTDGLEWYGLLVDYCGVFISCLDSHSDGTHSLQRIHWWASDVMLHFSKSDEETNLSTSSLAWVYFHQILNVWVNYSFKFKIICFNMDVVLPLLLCRFLGRFSNGCWNTDTVFCSCSDTNITEVRYVFVMESGLLFQCSLACAQVLPFLCRPHFVHWGISSRFDLFMYMNNSWMYSWLVFPVEHFVLYK